MITQGRLHDLFTYEPLAGVLLRKTAPTYNTYVGQVAGYVCATGYRFIKIKGIGYPAHRLIWLYVHGCWPAHEIDHINGRPADNRIENLRDVPHQLNVQNLRAPTSSSSTSILGVGPKGNRWRARITLDGKPRGLGTYATQEEARQAYITAKRALHQGCTI